MVNVYFGCTLPCDFKGIFMAVARPVHPDMHIFPAWCHPEVLYWAPTWAAIRDCLLGEQEVKFKGEFYLPRLEEMDDTEYDSYKERAVFYDMLSRTVEALSGSIFQRDPKITNIEKKVVDHLESTDCTANGIQFSEFLVEAAEGVIQMGRYGVLVDRDSAGKKPPFVRGYDAENIMDWQTKRIDGRDVLIQVVLREFNEVPNRLIGQARQYEVTTRVLSLDIEDGKKIYRQYVYTAEGINADLGQMAPEVFTPTIRGLPLDFIPFQFIGSKANTPNVSRPPMASISSLNLAHYRSYAQLEHGRYYTAMPIWYVTVNPTSNIRPVYKLGSSMVWEVAQGEKPGIIEYNGQGLKFLEKALADKELQIAQIGGRFMGGGSRSISESDEQASINERNERSLLLRIVRNINTSCTKVLHWMQMWMDINNPEAEVELNTGFLFDTLGARELRAAHAMYKEGIIPITALHHYLLKAEVIPDWMDINEFKRLLGLIEEFPNQPDVWARKAGWADSDTEAEEEFRDREITVEETLAGIEQEKVDVDDKKVGEDTKIATARLALDRQKEQREARQPKQVAAARATAKAPAR